MSEPSTLDLLSDLAEIMAFILMLVIGIAYLVTEGDAIAFDETVVILLVNLGTVSLSGGSD